MYSEKDLAAIAKRENNNKRKYLVVNRLQGKHIPVNPVKTLEMFGELAECVRTGLPEEKLLLVGFAETATAIGAALSTELGTYYMQTTRENIDGVEYFYFSESHSHATEQKLVEDDVNRIINDVDRVVFVEDEVTTGNTILNIIRLMEERYPDKLKFAVASLLNGMDAEHELIYREQNIPLYYLVKTQHSAYTQIAESYRGDGEYMLPAVARAAGVPVMDVADYVNTRRLTDGASYQKACERLWSGIWEKFSKESFERVLVLGTEEFMYPAIYVGARFVEEGKQAFTHSTTRSPIAVSFEEEYPLHKRYELRSLYDRERVTFVYDLKKYDRVIILTDARIENEGLNTLVNALESAGNSRIDVIRWCEK